ncbi:MAG: type II secretion system F family protein [Candidatus Kerfeldbacteria bacterium]|nr:type II secretion system F family protein [Candidatus Kerfeldbacteria bacterium]
MAQFRYIARTRSGESLHGTIEAVSESAVQDSMREKDLILLSVVEVKSSQLALQIKQLTRRIGVKDLVIFSRQLAVLISATVPIVRALRILSKQTESKALRTIIVKLADTVDGGAPLSAALKDQGHIFDDFFVYMVKAGETTGKLDDVLTYLAEQKYGDYQLKNRIVSALIYPALIIVVMSAVFIFMMVYVVPKMLDVVSQTSMKLPFATQALLTISNIIQGYWLFMLLGLFLLAVVYVFARTQPAGRMVIDKAKLRIPIFGNIFRNIALARLSRSLANLLASGVPLNKSIEIASDVIGNVVYKDIMMQAKKEIEGGRALSDAVGRHTYITPMFAQMINVGEETGKIDQILFKVAEFYSNEVSNLTATLVSIFEPLIIVILGGGALVLVLGILLPIYQITAQF